jgi:hypothetical protein
MNAEETKPADVDFELRAIHSEHRPDRADHDDAHFAQNVEGEARFAEFVCEPGETFLDFRCRGDRFRALTSGGRSHEHIQQLLVNR